MAREDTNYIGVAMGMDVTDLKAGLTEASKRIGEANADFRAASSAMDDWTKSTEGLSLKVRQLDSVLASQQSKLAGLRAEYERVAAEQGENSVAARNLYIRMQNQQAVVNSTERELRNYRETLEQAEAGTLDLTQVTLRAGRAIQTAGNDAEDAGNKFSGFGKAVKTGLLAIGGLTAGAVTGFLALGESTREAREDMAKLTSAFDGAGLSGESANKTFTDLYKVIGETDTAVEASQQIALLAKSEEEAAKWAELATGVTATFGDALKPETFYEAANETLKLGEATGAFTQMLEGTGINVEQFNAELATMTTEQEKQAYMLKVSEEAMGAAGKAYEETAGSIMEAREAEAELSLATQELGAAAEPIMTELKKGFAEVLRVIKDLITNTDFEPLKAGIRDVFQVFTDTILPVLIGGLKWILDNIKPITAGIVGLGAAFLAWKVAGIIQGIVGAMKAWTVATQGQTIAQRALNLVMKANPIGIIVTLIAGLVAAFITLWNTSDKFKQFWLNAWQSIKDACSKAWQGITGVFSKVGSFFSGVADTIVGFFKSIPNKVKSIGEDIVKGLWNGINDMADWISKKIKGFGENVLGGIKKFFGIKSPSRVMRDEVGKMLGEGVGVGLIESIPHVKQQLNKFGNFVTDNMGGIKSGLAVSGAGGLGSRSGGTINAPLTINYNGNLSRKQIKQLENDQYNSILMKMRTQGVVR